MSAAPDGAILAPMGAVAVAEGDCLMASSYTLVKTTDVASVCEGIAAETSLDDTGTALTLTSGDFWPVYPLGCGKIVNVRSLTGQTWRWGAIVYLDQTASADGCVETSSSNSPTKIGIYVGPDNVATSGTTLIRVLLCYPRGTT